VEISASGKGNAEDSSEVYLDTLSSGDWFGEIALLEQTRRTATVTAREECMLLYLSRDNFQRFLRLAPEVLQSGLFDQIVRRRTANSLKAIPIFSVLMKKRVGPLQQFDEERLALLGGLFRFVQKQAEETIFKEGDDGDAFYIIVRGKCAVSAKSPDNKEVLLNELGANDWFGEASLLHNSKCNANVVAKASSVLLMLKGENFNK